jgi:hypothetical protein
MSASEPYQRDFGRAIWLVSLFELVHANPSINERRSHVSSRDEVNSGRWSVQDSIKTNIGFMGRHDRRHQRAENNDAQHKSTNG